MRIRPPVEYSRRPRKWRTPAVAHIHTTSLNLLGVHSMYWRKHAIWVRVRVRVRVRVTVGVRVRAKHRLVERQALALGA